MSDKLTIGSIQQLTSITGDTAAIALGGEGAMWFAGEPSRRIAELERELSAAQERIARYETIINESATECEVAGRPDGELLTTSVKAIIARAESAEQRLAVLDAIQAHEAQTGHPAPEWVGKKAAMDFYNDDGPLWSPNGGPTYRDEFLAWAREHMGQGYSLAISEGSFIDTTTGYAYSGYLAGRSARGIDSPEGVETGTGSIAQRPEPGPDRDAPKNEDAPKDRAAEQRVAALEADARRLFMAAMDLLYALDHQLPRLGETDALRNATVAHAALSPRQPEPGTGA